MFYFGVDYYPEQWPAERWPIDAALMAEAGFNVVRLAEFAWSRLEPAPGRFDFAWLDRAMDVLAARGIKIVLGTPTASPPPWLMQGQPELFRMRADGTRLTFGNRREYCPNHPAYHSATQRVVSALAEQYAGHPAVIGWQIDNEFGDRCYCPVCAEAFQGWLERKYGTLDTLNERWGTVFWSHVYSAWSEIPLPASTGGSPNPGLALDFYRFASDSYAQYQQSQLERLRAACPGHFITHNFMGFNYDQLNYFDLARELDFVAWDNYPRTQWHMAGSVTPSAAALGHATMRGLKRRNFWVMEQQGGQGGWEMLSVAPRPGELRLWAYQAIAHGADAIVFFRWRTARYGAEQYWHGLLDHDAVPGRRYAEIKRMGAELAHAGRHIHGAQARPAVSMLLSYDSRFAFQIQANNPQFSYARHFHQIYQALHDCQAGVDVAAPETDLAGYKLVIAPALHVLGEAAAENLKRYVAAGGWLLVTQRAGVKDEANAVVNQRLPGLLAALCGVEVEEYDSLASDMENGVEFCLPGLAEAGRIPVGPLCDVLKTTSATVLARYTDDYYAGQPALTLNQYGQGQVVYAGAAGGERLYAALVGWLLEQVELKPPIAAPRGVEVTERWQGDRRLLFVLNHTTAPQAITLDQPYRQLLDGHAPLKGQVTLAPRDVLVLAEAEEDLAEPVAA